MQKYNFFSEEKRFSGKPFAGISREIDLDRVKTYLIFETSGGFGECLYAGV